MPERNARIAHFNFQLRSKARSGIIHLDLNPRQEPLQASTRALRWRKGFFMSAGWKASVNLVLFHEDEIPWSKSCLLALREGYAG
jgi:hypothetical protein